LREKHVYNSPASPITIRIFANRHNNSFIVLL